MSWSKVTIPLSIDTAASHSTAKNRCELIKIDNTGLVDGNLANTDNMALPLLSDLSATADAADVAVGGVAEVYVETATGIIAGSKLGIGSTGKGVCNYTTGYCVGTALKAPAGDGDTIPCLIKAETETGIY